MLLLAASSVFWPAVAFLVVAGSLLLLSLLFGSADPRVAGRFDELASGEGRDIAPPRRGWLRLAGPQLSEWAEVLVPNDAADRTRLQGRLFQAGIYSPAALSAFLAAKLIAMIAAPVGFLAAGWLGMLPFSQALLIGSLLGLAGGLLPGWWLARRRAKRHLVLRRSLPDFLDLIVTCLEAGLSMQAALKQVSDELRLAHPVLTQELSMVLSELELGRTLDRGLANLASRTGLEELRTLSTFVAQATRFGTTMADAMRQLGEMLRAQREQRAEELAQKAAVKILFPTLIFIFPTVFVVLAGPAAIQIQEGLIRSKGQAAALESRK